MIEARADMDIDGQKIRYVSGIILPLAKNIVCSIFISHLSYYVKFIYFTVILISITELMQLRLKKFSLIE